MICFFDICKKNHIDIVIEKKTTCWLADHKYQTMKTEFIKLTPCSSVFHYFTTASVKPKVNHSVKIKTMYLSTYNSLYIPNSGVDYNKILYR